MKGNCVALAIFLGAVNLIAQENKDAPAPEVKSVPKVALMPGDFLDNVGQQAKARWRQFYREAPLAPDAERLRTAFNLGTLVADSYLAQQAADTQQFKNTNQDLMTYCKVLGFGEKLAPNFLVSAKMAEREDWPAVRKQVSDIQQRIEKLLIDQRDEDLATLVDLGMWMRLFKITTAIVSESEEIQNKTLCIGSPKLLDELKARFGKMSDATRKNDLIAALGNVLDLLHRHWQDSDGRPKPEAIAFSLDKLTYLFDRLMKQE